MTKHLQARREYQFSFLNSHFSTSCGFTLIELLVVIGAFAIISTIILGVIVTVLRSTQNSDSLINVRQNGEYAMTQMISKLRFAQNLNYPSVFGGTAPACTAAGINVPKVIITDVNQNQITINCPSKYTSPNYIDINGTQLTNSANVLVKSCSLSCTQSSAGTPTIGISFTLQKINSSGLPEGNVKIPFESSVTLRNIGS